MYVVLDSTEIRRDLKLEKTSMRLLLDYKDNTGLKVAIPEIVILETVNHVREEATNVAEANNERIDKIRNIAGIRIGSHISKTLISKKVEEYEDELRKVVSAKFDKVLPIPNIAHQDLIERDLHRKKPFARNGKGYRDALIWISIIKFAKEKQTNVAFISSNVTDFSDGDSTLHQDLRDELLSEGLFYNIQYFKSLYDFVGDIVIPRLPEEDQSIARFEQESKTSFEDVLRDKVSDILCGEYIDHMNIDIEHYYHDIQIEDVYWLSINVLEDKELDDSRRLIRLETELELELYAYVYSEYYGELIATEGYNPRELALESSSTGLSFDHTINATINVTIDILDGHIVDLEIEEL